MNEYTVKTIEFYNNLFQSDNSSKSTNDIKREFFQHHMSQYLNLMRLKGDTVDHKDIDQNCESVWQTLLIVLFLFIVIYLISQLEDRNRYWK